eukprot:jgi/Ulvmu1/1307/UM011_0034.1
MKATVATFGALAIMAALGADAARADPGVGASVLAGRRMLTRPGARAAAIVGMHAEEAHRRRLNYYVSGGEGGEGGEGSEGGSEGDRGGKFGGEGGEGSEGGEGGSEGGSESGGHNPYPYKW